MRNLFDQEDELYEGIRYLFNESIILYEMKQSCLEYEEIENLMSIQSRKENCKYTSFIHERIEQEEVIEYKVNYCEVNDEYEHVKGADYVITRTFLIDDEYLMYEIVEIIKEKKVDYIKQKPRLIYYECIVIEEKKAEYCGVEEQNALEYEEIKKLMSVIRKKKTEIIEEKIECCRTEEKKDELMLSIVKYDVEIIDDKKVEDIRMSKSSRKLVLPKRILKVIAREIGVKNYENLTKSELIKEANKLKPSKKNDFEKIVFEKYPKKDELRRKDIRKSFRVKKERKDIIGKDKKRVEKIRPKKESKKILEIKKNC